MTMKEEKDHRPKEKRVTLLTPQGATGSSAGATAEGAKGEDKQDRNREKKEALSKVPTGGWPERGRDVYTGWRGWLGTGLFSPSPGFLFSF